ncbi:4-hydroxyphenylacetate 3-hydroxylase N-terminal domain-containing protein [Sphingomonas sp.]|uniref:4-hydroxyphenylacetate 3-hydroxylase family protein n=1 Tax=Sphingomonas sp. TaxID=28214 RepID=UPI0025F53707|nr:4-hydroxyphenylacetate 3-hydroxylase N-terminal domain-containing protein [Sphingomonas sp.]MBV9528261.1 4-hydroxyphenylacetate 3-monooxygenase [Sphingomonas sp.]
MKSGTDHLTSLRDGRTVFISGSEADDVTAHPAFRNAVQSAASLYDFQSAPENLELMTIVSPSSGERVNRTWALPTSFDELVERRRAMEAWAGTHYGFMGRSPDHVASCLAGMLMGIDVFRSYDPARAGALQDYFRYARDNDLFLTYVIINPQADRSKGAAEQADPYLTAGIVDEDAEGLTLRGAKMLATSGIMANEVFVSCIQPLGPGDEKYAVSLALPMNTKGVKLLSRKSYEAAAPSVFDNPLASRFDENDAVIYFDDVKVPWERVFVAGDTGMMMRQFHATPAHVLQNYQCQVRLMVKLRFLMGIARRIAEVNGIIALPPVRDTLGQLAAEAALVDGMVHGMEAKGAQRGDYFLPDAHLLYSAQVLTQQLYSKMITTLRDLAGGGLIMLPSDVSDFENPEIARLIGKTQQSPVLGSEERVKFFKLAWDAIGSEFASRHTQYEMFYAGATFVTRGHSFRTYDWSLGAAMVDKVMGSYERERGIPPERFSSLPAEVVPAIC